MSVKQASHYIFHPPALQVSSGGKLSPLNTSTWLFIFVSLMDFVMTFLLLQTGSFRESNPLADYCLSCWGWVGMGAFKLVVVSIVILAVNIISLQRIKTAQCILWFGFIFTGTVVLYSTFLLTSHYNLIG